MRYSEFKRLAQHNSWLVEEDTYTRLTIKDLHKCSISISKTDRSILWIDTSEYCQEGVTKVLKAAIKLAETPLLDREDTKYYEVKLPNLKTSDGSEQYLSFYDGDYFASRKEKPNKRKC